MRTEFIMDVGSNHNQDMERISRLIEAAKNIGCMAVKFQLFNEDLYAPEFKKKRDEISRTKLHRERVGEIALICKGLGIQFHCTPFNLEAVDFLKAHVDEFKIGSYEILWTELISRCLATGKPVSISLGNANEEDIWNAVKLVESPFIDSYKCIYICDSHYPARIQDSKIYKLIESLRDDFLKYPFGGTYGYSDHTHNFGVILRVARYAQRVELHGDLDDMMGAESHHGHVWKVSEISDLIQMVRDGEAAEKYSTSFELDPAISKWRTDPTDGHRPLKEYREELLHGTD